MNIKEFPNITIQLISVLKGKQDYIVDHNGEKFKAQLLKLNKNKLEK